MSQLIISNWIGRTGNNILQIIRAIHYGKVNGYNILLFKHLYFSNGTVNKIILNTNKNMKKTISATFFNIKDLGCNDPNPRLMKIYFNKYLKNIFLFNVKNKYSNNDNSLAIHIRAGDIFRGNGAHSAYVQPPLKYYKDIIESRNWDKVTVVYEDIGNPCVNALMDENYENIHFTSNNLKTDINILCQFQNLVLGFGTFGLLLFFLNENIKNIYIPKYVIEELPKGNWGDVTMNIIDLPNYIKCGEWKNEESQKRMMLNYK
tara:strand:+ start:414 stop:1196 length:783 start_codon:yes stop_codon:yes gene_type:complete